MIRLPVPEPIQAVCAGAWLEGQPFDAADPGQVLRLATLCGLPELPRQATQEHGTRIDHRGDGLACDAFRIGAGEAALVRHADCMPVVVCDPVASVAVVAHCGWRGIQAGLPGKCLELLLSEGSRMENLRVFAGPSIGARSFEVSREFQTGFPEESWTTTSLGTPAVDLARVVASQLARLGLPARSWSPPTTDTFTDPDWHSHRATGTPRRNATLCWIPRASISQ